MQLWDGSSGSIPVWIIKHDLLHDGEEGQLQQSPVEGGELGAAGLPSPALQVVGGHHHRPGDHGPVEEDALQRVTQLLRIHLEVSSRRQSVRSFHKGHSMMSTSRARRVAGECIFSQKFNAHHVLFWWQNCLNAYYHSAAAISIHLLRHLQLLSNRCNYLSIRNTGTQIYVKHVKTLGKKVCLVRATSSIWH